MEDFSKNIFSGSQPDPPRVFRKDTLQDFKSFILKGSYGDMSNPPNDPKECVAKSANPKPKVSAKRVLQTHFPHVSGRH